MRKKRIHKVVLYSFMPDVFSRRRSKIELNQAKREGWYLRKKNSKCLDTRPVYFKRDQSHRCSNSNKYQRNASMTHYFIGLGWIQFSRAISTDDRKNFHAEILFSFVFFTLYRIIFNDLCMFGLMGHNWRICELLKKEII